MPLVIGPNGPVAARAKTPGNPSPAYMSDMAKDPTMPPPPSTDPLDLATMTPEELCDRLEEYEFTCPGCDLKNTVEWIELRRRLGTPSPRWG